MANKNLTTNYLTRLSNVSPDLGTGSGDTPSGGGSNPEGDDEN